MLIYRRQARIMDYKDIYEIVKDFLWIGVKISSN